MDKYQQWHRWFGMCWTDFFIGTSVTVEMEKDMSLQQQFLDVVVVRKGSEPWPDDLPDSFDDPAEHNLISFKSFQEPLGTFALRELDGHYVNYRKQISPDKDDLIDEAKFRLIAVSVCKPVGLIRDAPLKKIQAGVYRAPIFDGEIRVISVHELPETPNNAMLHLFSRQRALIEYGQKNYRQRSEQTSTFLHQLLNRYREEGIMPFTYEQGIKDAHREILNNTPIEERLAGIPVEKVLEVVPVEKILEVAHLEQLSPEAKAELIRRLQGDPQPKS